MRKLWLLMNVSLDGYFEGLGHDISWSKDTDFEAFSSEPSNEEGVGTFLLGRKTYEMIRDFWTTPQAQEIAPEIAKVLNETPKVVVSHNKSFEPGWHNAMVISDHVAGAVKKLKEQPGKSIAMFGSNTLCVSLMQEGLVDEFRLVVSPVALGEGTSLFKGLPKKAELTLTKTRKFKSGPIMLTYQPVDR